MKYTPGPWHAPIDLALSRYKAGKPLDCEIPVTAGDRPIAFVSHYCAEERISVRVTDRNRIEMQEANASLIAAAPDLLEALKAAMDNSYGGEICDRTDCLDSWRTQARAAIRKAEEGK